MGLNCEGPLIPGVFSINTQLAFLICGFHQPADSVQYYVYSPGLVVSEDAESTDTQGWLWNLSIPGRSWSQFPAEIKRQLYKNQQNIFEKHQIQSLKINTEFENTMDKYQLGGKLKGIKE